MVQRSHWVREAGRRLAGRLGPPPHQAAELSDQEIIDRFHRLYYDAEQHGGTWRDTWFLGVPFRKCALDAWIYQEILHELRPELIVECGTFAGGSALYLASICELLGSGRVVSIDIAPQPDLPSHPRLTYIVGSTTSDEVHRQVCDAAAGSSATLVILDSDHSCEHVLRELRMYSPLVTVGSYVIVEDTNINGHPVVPDFGPGPHEAVRAFLDDNQEFELDASKEKFLLSFNPGGHLRRVRS
jgi:cephalosporin hydroxylase